MNRDERRKYVFAQLNSLPNAFQYVEVTNYIKSLEQENEKLNHYKLLYQKVKERNTEAIEYLEQQLEYSKKDCIPARQFTCEKSLKILEGNNEVSDD